MEIFSAISSFANRPANKLSVTKYSYPDLRFIEDYRTGLWSLFMSASDSGNIYLGDVYYKGKTGACLGQFSVTDNIYKEILKNDIGLDFFISRSNYFFCSAGNILYYYKKSILLLFTFEIDK